jgi:hypothetical protein
MHEQESLRRTLYEWAEEHGIAASLVGAMAHLRGWQPSRSLTLDEFEDAVETLAHGRWG